MDGFLLAQPGGVVRTEGVRRAFDDAESAAAELAGGTAELIVGALPFDPRNPAALCVPERAQHTAGPWRPAELPPLPEVRLITEIPSAAEHIARVAKLVEQLADRSQPLRKVVAARSVLVQADQPLDPEVVAAQLLSRHPRANVFAVDLSPAGRPGATLVGATPEVLVARHGETVTLRPLAGTIARHRDPDLDAERSRELLASPKNRAEHAFVIDWIRAQLAPLCELTVPDGPELTNTHEVWHLATPIRGRVRDPHTTAFDLARALHPTPAVCGTPTDLALDAITTTEQDRGFYGGAVGWCDARGDGEWVVAIRCAELSADGLTVRAFGGGGIVAASDPRAELDETTAKLRTFLGSLNCAV